MLKSQVDRLLSCDVDRRYTVDKETLLEKVEVNFPSIRKHIPSGLELWEIKDFLMYNPIATTKEQLFHDLLIYVSKVRHIISVDDDKCCVEYADYRLTTEPLESLLFRGFCSGSNFLDVLFSKVRPDIAVTDRIALASKLFKASNRLNTLFEMFPTELYKKYKDSLANMK